MALFQKTVITKYLQTQNSENLITKWDLFCAHFHNPTIQENIRNSKEEQYQEGFLRDLFVSILGYQLNPAHNFNLTTEYKNIKDSKKADGAIIIDEVVTAIIELKGMNITDLSKVEDQAGKTAQIDHPFSDEIDHLFRSKLTTYFRSKLTT